MKAAGFTAYLTHDMTATLAKPIVFQETLTNTGRHYDVETGEGESSILKHICQ